MPGEEKPRIPLQPALEARRCPVGQAIAIRRWYGPHVLFIGGILEALARSERKAQAERLQKDDRGFRYMKHGNLVPKIWRRRARKVGVHRSLFCRERVNQARQELESHSENPTRRYLHRFLAR